MNKKWMIGLIAGIFIVVVFVGIREIPYSWILEGKTVLKFLESKYIEKYGDTGNIEHNGPYPYKIKYNNNYYGIDIKFSINPPALM